MDANFAFSKKSKTNYCDGSGPGEVGSDSDWGYFYARENHAYEIYAQDLSEYGYFNRLTLCSIEGSPIVHKGNLLTVNNYLALTYPEDSTYDTKTRKKDNRETIKCALEIFLMNFHQEPLPWIYDTSLCEIIYREKLIKSHSMHPGNGVCTISLLHTDRLQAVR